MDKMKSYNLNNLRKISSKKILFKRASSELVSTKLIVIILVVLVLLAVAFFLIKGDILDWIKQLPSFGSANDTEVEVTPDVGVVSNGVEVGRIGVISGGKQYIRVIYADKKSEDTFFYWKGDAYSAKIMYKSNLFWGYETISRDIQVGSYNARTGMIINSEYFNKNSEFYKKILLSGGKNYFNVKALSRINGSFMKGNTLYKDKDVPNAEITGGRIIDIYNPNNEINLDVSKTIIQASDGTVIINLHDYFNYDLEVSTLNLKNDRGIIYIFIPDNGGFFESDRIIGKITQDDSVWLKIYEKVKPKYPPVQVDSVNEKDGFLPSNIRINYNEVNNFFVKK